MEEDMIRKNIISEMIFDKLFSVMELDSKGNATIDAYDLSGRDIAYLLEKYDKQRFDITMELLKVKENEEE